jgi:imidazolonepropionase-like amidohydrolase
MVAAGMTPEQVLVAATATSAALLGWQGKVGTLAPGAYADLLVLKEDPHTDIHAVEQVELVMKGGAVVRDERGK